MAVVIENDNQWARDECCLVISMIRLLVETRGLVQ